MTAQKLILEMTLRTSLGEFFVKNRAYAFGLAGDFLDQAAVQQLFGIRERRAQQLFRSWGVQRFGNASVISRTWLIEYLERMPRMANTCGKLGGVTSPRSADPARS